MLKTGIDGWGILCSRNARPRKDLVGRAQIGLPQPSFERELNLRPCLGQGAFLRAGVGRVRKLAVLNILLRAF